MVNMSSRDKHRTNIKISMSSSTDQHFHIHEPTNNNKFYKTKEVLLKTRFENRSMKALENGQFMRDKIRNCFELHKTKNFSCSETNLVIWRGWGSNMEGLGVKQHIKIMKIIKIYHFYPFFKNYKGGVGHNPARSVPVLLLIDRFLV